MVNEASITKSRDGSMDFELSDQFFYSAVALTQGGELPLGSGLAVWVCKHLVKFRYESCPYQLFHIGWVEDGVDFLCSPRACGSSLHGSQDKHDIDVLGQEL